MTYFGTHLVELWKWVHAPKQWWAAISDYKARTEKWFFYSNLTEILQPGCVLTILKCKYIHIHLINGVLN